MDFALTKDQQAIRDAVAGILKSLARSATFSYEDRAQRFDAPCAFDLQVPLHSGKMPCVWTSLQLA